MVIPSKNQDDHCDDSGGITIEEEIPNRAEEKEKTESECSPLAPVPPKPKLLPNTWSEPLSHHMTIGPHVSVDWVC